MRLLLLPGLDGTGLLFSRLVGELNGKLPVEVVAYPSDQPLDYRQLAIRVAEYMSDEVVLLGESFSGPIAIDLARQFPDKVRGLVLAGTFARPPWPGWLMKIGAKVDHHEVPFSLLRMMLLGNTKSDVLTSELGEIVRALPAATIACRLRSIAEVDALAALGNVKCEILMLHAANDRLVSGRPLKRALERRPDTTVAFIPGPHMILQTQPAIAARHILDFVSSLSRAGQ
jgi:pimeloyl-ACP methyl ester carboxylesterase